MVTTPDELARVLQGTTLAGRPVEVFSIPGEHDQALVVRCAPEDVPDDWQVLRGVLGETGRWPVATVAWGEPLGPGLFSRYGFGEHAGADASVAGILTRAESTDPLDVIAELARGANQRDALGEDLYFELEQTAENVGAAPDQGSVRSALGPRCSRAELDRWLLDWEEAHRARPIDSSPGHLEWFDPTGMETAVILLPTPHGWQAPAYMSFFGAEGAGGAEKLIAVLRSWNEMYGAELVAHYGTMLQFVVGRPPQNLDDAWQLAREQELIAECTTVLPGLSLRDHARALIGLPTWFLHERP